MSSLNTSIELTSTQRLCMAIYGRLPQRDIEKADIPDLLSILKTLTYLEEQVILKRFGIGCDMATHSEISKEYATTASRIKQIERKAISKLQQEERGRMVRILFATYADLRKQITESIAENKALREENLQLRTTNTVLAQKCYSDASAKKANSTAVKDGNETIVLDFSIEEIGLSTRVYNALVKEGIKTVQMLALYDHKDLCHIKNLGIVGIREIESKRNELGIIPIVR